MKKMRYFNGTCPLMRSEGRGYICAYSKAQAVRIGKMAFGNTFSLSELNNYWSECWGYSAEEILGKQSEPGAFWAVGETHFFKAVLGDDLT
jgi:hypothetical protein